MAKSRRPSLKLPPASAAADESPAPGWVYRTDEPAGASPLAASTGPAPPDPIVPVSASPAPRPSRGAARIRRRRTVVDRGLTSASFPFALALVTALQPLSWLSGGRRLRS
jgi:hypothetical protein